MKYDNIRRRRLYFIALIGVFISKLAVESAIIRSSCL